jgi:hypothetical protein
MYFCVEFIDIPAPGTVSGSLDGQTKYGVENDQVSFSMR